MTISYTPIIRMVDTCSFGSPMQVMATRMDGDKVWWKHAPVVPKIVTTDRTKVKIIASEGADRFVSYLFTQLFFNINLYNDLRLDIPQKFYLDGDSTFYYFMDIDKDVVVVPLFYRHPTVQILFTKFKDRPALKLSVTSEQELMSSTNPKRQRQYE